MCVHSVCLCVYVVKIPVFVSLSISPQTSIWPSWYGVQDEESVGEPSTSPPPAASFSHMDMPPPYEAVSGGNTCRIWLGDETPLKVVHVLSKEGANVTFRVDGFYLSQILQPTQDCIGAT